MSREVHVCVDVRGVLRWPKRKLHGLMRDETGRALTADQVRDALLDHLAAGHEVLPFGQPCDGFDWKNGCPGHEVEPSPADT